MVLAVQYDYDGGGAATAPLTVGFWTLLVVQFIIIIIMLCVVVVAALMALW